MTDFLIIGGGLIGMLTARALRKSGASVTLVEKGEMAKESSWAGGGILSPLYPWRYDEAVTELAGWSQKNYPQFAQQLLEETGIDPEYRKSGLLVLDQGEREQAIAWATTHQVQYELLDQAAASRLAPEVRITGDVLYFPTVGQLRNPRLAAAMKKSLQQLGVICHEGEEIISLECEAGRVVGANSATNQYRAGKVVVCGGAWSNQILGDLAGSLRVEPIKGQMIQFMASPTLLTQIILADGHYLIPRRDGRILVGSTLENCGFDKQITKNALSELKNYAVTIVPALEKCEVVAHWAGLRPGSQHGIPYIAEHTEVQGLFVNAGHYRNGVVTALASVEILTSLLLDRESELPTELYGWQSDRGNGEMADMLA